MDSNPSSSQTYIRAEERIYQYAADKENLDWKNFIYSLIKEENLNPWNIDLGILTRKYLSALKEIKTIDFDISGKFLTIAVFLLKIKTQNLIEKDLRGIEEEIAFLESDSTNFQSDIDSLEQLDSELENIKQKREKYVLKYRNPLARKRKVNIYDLISILEKTIDQSNKRRANFFQRNTQIKYEGPIYEKKPKDLKEIIEELFTFIIEEIDKNQNHITFSHITTEKETRKEKLLKFISLLHLHTQNKIILEQEEHFGTIKIHKVY